MGFAAKLMTSRPLRMALLVGTFFTPQFASAELELTGFRQSVAEAAARTDDLAAFYRGQQFDGLWTGSDQGAQDRRNALLNALNQAHQHGLPAERYDIGGLIERLQLARTAQQQGAMEVELSQTLIAYANDVHGGLLDPGRTISAIKREAPELNGSDVLDAFASAASPAAYLRSLAPTSPEYSRLMRQKLMIEQMINAGGWGPAVTGGSIGPGTSGNQVIALRDRLMAMGYLGRSVTQAYDEDILRAVQAFQLSHGMTPDGVVGEGTMRALNVSAASRLEQILVAMERERWLNVDRGARHIWVNLTDFHATVIDDDRVSFSTRAVIGALDDDRETPEFSDIMTHMVINPSWNVPRSITVNEYLPGLQRNASAHGHLQVIDRRGRVVSRGSVDFSQFTARSFPYSMRQPPSRSNALGLVKFMFPNQWNIYLHDTPAQSLFQREVRAFSHGCIRLDDPFDFAYHLLAVQNDDPVGFFQARLRSGQESYVNLDAAVPVHLVYRTAFTDVEGNLQFRRDIYGRDARIWRALSAAGVVIGGVQG